MTNTTTIHLQLAARNVEPRGAEALGEFAALVFRAVSSFFSKVAELRTHVKYDQGLSVAKA